MSLAIGSSIIIVDVLTGLTLLDYCGLDLEPSDTTGQRVDIPRLGTGNLK